MSEAPVNRSRWLVLCLSLIPLWLALSAGVAVWWSLQDDDKEEEERNQRFAMEMSEERIADDMRKLVEVIGPRNLAHPENLMRAAAMIDGTLGPSNTGYQIKRIPGPYGAPIIRASLEQSKNDGRSIWVVAAYDSSDKNPATESSATAALIAAAQAMARDDLPTDIHFLLFPHGHNPFTPVQEQVKLLKSIMQEPSFVAYISHMSLGKGLIFNTPEAKQSDGKSSSIDPSSTQGLGITHQSIGLGFAAAAFHEAGLMAVEVYAHENASTGNDPANIAISTGKFVEWLRRAARLEAVK